MTFDECVSQLLEDFGVPYAPQNIGPNSLSYSSRGNLSQKPSVPQIKSLGDSAGGTQNVLVPGRLFPNKRRKQRPQQ